MAYEHRAVGDVRGRLPDFQVHHDRLATVCIDMQYWFADRHVGYGSRAEAATDAAHRFDYYFDRLEHTVIPNTTRLLTLCRQRHIPVFLVRVAAKRPDAADTSWRYKQWGLVAPPTAKECEILVELGPQPGDVVVDKTTSNVFMSTNLDFQLRNMAVDSLIICGVSTNGCVESSTRGAGDLGYRTYLLSDATATYTEALHEESLRDMDHNFAIVKSTDQVVAEIVANCPADNPTKR